MQLNIYKIEAEELDFKDIVISFLVGVGEIHFPNKNSFGTLGSQHLGVQAQDKIDSLITRFGDIKRWSLIYKDTTGCVPWADDFAVASSFNRGNINIISNSSENYGGCIVLYGENLNNLPRIPGSDDLPPNKATYVLTWGHAWRIAEKYRVDDFGIRVVANLTEKDKLLKVEAKEIEMNGRTVSSRIHQPSNFSRFKIDLKSEATHSFLGQVSLDKNGFLGRNGKISSIRMAGGAGLKFGSRNYRPPTDIKLIEDIFELGVTYYSENYKNKHKFLDNLQKIKKDSPVYLSVMDEIFDGMNNSSLDYILDIEDADLLVPENFEYDAQVPISSQNFRKINHSYVDFSGDNKKRRLSSILRAQVLVGSDNYIYFEGDIYRVPQSIIDLIDKNLNRVIFEDNLISRPWKKTYKDREIDYNQYISQSQSNFMSLDQVFYRVSAGQDKIEICDLVASEGYIVHLKQDRGPASISHLSAQVYTSAFTLNESNGVASDYENIFMQGPGKASPLLNGFIDSASISKASEVPHQNSSSPNLKRDRFKFTICIAKDWGDRKGNGNSEKRILGMSYLRKVVLSGLVDSIQEMGFDLHATTVSIIP